MSQRIRSPALSLVFPHWLYYHFHLLTSSLNFKSKDVPGEVRQLEISPTNPKQLLIGYEHSYLELWDGLTWKPISVFGPFKVERNCRCLVSAWLCDVNAQFKDLVYKFVNQCVFNVIFTSLLDDGAWHGISTGFTFLSNTHNNNTWLQQHSNFNYIFQ